MSTNPAEAYGKDVRCFDDADALWSDVTGLGVVVQDVYHRLTNDSVLGSTEEAVNPDADNWGFDVTRLAGMSIDDLASMPPVISAAAQKDPRVATCDVSIQSKRVVGGRFYNVILTVICTTALGPFRLVLGINDVTVAILAGASA